MILLLIYQTLIDMQKQIKQEHFYILPSGEIASNQKEARIKLGIGRNAFRNRVRSGEIKKITETNKPQGYENEFNSTLR